MNETMNDLLLRMCSCMRIYIDLLSTGLSFIFHGKQSSPMLRYFRYVGLTKDQKIFFQSTVSENLLREW